MMKEKTSRVLFLGFLMFCLILSGCGSQPASQSSGGSGSAQPSQETEAGTSQNGQEGQPGDTAAGTDGMGDRLAKVYTDILQGDRNLIKYRTTIDMDGEVAEAQIEVAKDGDIIAMRTLLPGVENNMVKKDNKVYMVDHNTKTVMVMNVTAAPDMEDPGQYTADLSYVSSGTGDFLGRTLPYEEYAVENGTIQYFFDGKVLAGMIFHSQTGDQVLEILEISDQVPAEMFMIPEDYPQTMIGG